MGIALILIGFFALLAGLVVGVIALVRRARARPAKRTGLGAGGLAVTGLVLFSIGGALSPAATPSSTDQAADTTAPSPSTPAAVPVVATSATTPAATPGSAAATTAPAAPQVTTPAPPPAPATTAPAPPPAPPPPPARPAAPPPTRPTAAAGPARAAPRPAAAAVAALAVKGRAPKTGYSREQFGPAWADVDGNGCDTRNDVLRRDLASVQVTAGSGGCEVATGVLADPYSGTRIAFTRGAATSADVQIDHVVALSDAWQTGAFTWTPDKREQFANDPLNLLAVSGSLNEAKGDGDAATWLPPNKGERCAYVARQVAVKTAYALWVTPAEQQATTRILGGCPDQALPTETGTTPPAIDAAAAVAAPASAPRVHRSTAAPTVVAPAPSPVPKRTQPRRTEAPVAPGGGATALCRDGSLSYAQHHQGACSHHGGVKTFYK